MRIQISTLLIVATILIGCNSLSSNIKANVDNGVGEAMVSLDDTLIQAKAGFEQRFRPLLSANKNIQNIYSSVITTTNYIDSLKVEINKLDNNDVNNVQGIKVMFLNNGIGDTLFNKLNASYNLTIENVSSESKKAIIIKSQDNLLAGRDINKFNNQYFSLNSPLGATMILYGFEIQLLEDGQSCLN